MGWRDESLKESGPGRESMKKTLKLLVLLGSSFVLLSFGVIVVNQTAQVVELAGRAHPALGVATFWGLITIYSGLVGVPILMIVRMPRALTPPETEGGPEFEAHLVELGRRLDSNPYLQEPVGPRPTRRDVERALESLDAEADREVRKMARMVFMTTAVSQSGRLDALLVLAAQSRMVWRIAHIYYQRPSIREMAHLYSNVAATAFVAGELDSVELHQMIQPMVAASLGTVGGAIPGLQVITSVAVNSMISGSANAFLTLRIGMITRTYCGSLVAQPRNYVRKSATSRAARMLSDVVSDCGKQVIGALKDELWQKLPRPFGSRKAPEPV